MDIMLPEISGKFHQNAWGGMILQAKYQMIFVNISR